MISSKNFATSPAGVDLGLGGALKEQLAAEEEQRKKKMLQQAQQMSGSMSPAAQSLLGG